MRHALVTRLHKGIDDCVHRNIRLVLQVTIVYCVRNSTSSSTVCSEITSRMCKKWFLARFAVVVAGRHCIIAMYVFLLFILSKTRHRHRRRRRCHGPSTPISTTPQKSRSERIKFWTSVAKREFSDLKSTTRAEHSEMNATKKKPMTVPRRFQSTYTIEVYMHVG